jgi:hypothetical protein
MPRKEAAFGIASINHQEHKSELENKLKKMIHNYEHKNKELSIEMHHLELKAGSLNHHQNNQNNQHNQQQEKKSGDKVERKLFEV